jgi:hypothetical protein
MGPHMSDEIAKIKTDKTERDGNRNRRSKKE